MQRIMVDHYEQFPSPKLEDLEDLEDMDISLERHKSPGLNRE